MERRESEIRALLPEDGRFERLRREARALGERYPGPEERPPLFGLLFGVKDIFHADGWPTRAGSRLPPEALHGREAESVTRVKAAGALMLGKTVTTEFAHFTPGPTRNPHNPAHTPGGSSSGSAAAVAAGFCELALGTQTIGSIIRPAAFCGIAGLKPTYGRIYADGVIPLAPSLDHVGCLAADVPTAIRAARVLCTTWTEPPAPLPRPVFGLPDGPYLEQVPPDTAAWFADVCRVLVEAGYELRRVPVMHDFAAVRARHLTIQAAEAARVHAAWFREYEGLYGAKIAELIRAGRSIGEQQLAAARAGQLTFRADLERRMADAAIDAWICPSALGPAPQGLESTGDPVMNLPWTQAGLPAVGLPAGNHPAGLPMGLQIVGRWHADETLLAHAAALEGVFARVAGRLPTG